MGAAHTLHVKVASNAIKQLNQETGSLYNVEIENKDVLFALLLDFGIDRVDKRASVSLLHLI